MEKRIRSLFYYFIFRVI